MTVPAHDWLAYRVEFIVASRKNKRWTANAIVPATDREEWRREMQHEEKPEDLTQPGINQDDLTRTEEERIKRDREEQERKEREAHERDSQA